MSPAVFHSTTPTNPRGATPITLQTPGPTASFVPRTSRPPNADLPESVSPSTATSAPARNGIFSGSRSNRPSCRSRVEETKERRAHARHIAFARIRLAPIPIARRTMRDMPR